MPVRIRPAVAALPAYKPGRPAPAGSTGPAYKLSSNENPYPPLPGVLAATEAAVAQMNRYPDMANTAMTAARRRPAGRRPGAAGLRHRLGRRALPPAARPSASPATRWSSPGAASRPTRSRSRSPGPRRSGAAGPGRGARPRRHAGGDHPGHPRRHALHAQQPHRSGDRARRRRCLPRRGARATSWWWSTRRTSSSSTTRAAVRGLELLRDRPNVVVLRTFSKAYGLAGFRVGYCVAEPALAAAVRAVSLPFGVSVAAQAAVLASPGGRAGTAGAGRRAGRARGRPARRPARRSASTCPTPRATSSGCPPGR